MAEIVAALLTSHAPLITGKPEVSRPEQRDRLYGGFHELRRRLAAARPDLIVMFVNDHIQNFPYSNMPAFCIGLAEAYDAPSPGGSRLMRIPPRKVRGAPEWGRALLELGLEERSPPLGSAPDLARWDPHQPRAARARRIVGLRQADAEGGHIAIGKVLDVVVHEHHDEIGARRGEPPAELVKAAVQPVPLLGPRHLGLPGDQRRV